MALVLANYNVAAFCADEGKISRHYRSGQQQYTRSFPYLILLRALELQLTSQRNPYSPCFENQFRSAEVLQGWRKAIIYPAFIGTGSGNQIKSFFVAYEAVKTTLNDQVGWWGHIGRVISFFTWADVC